MNLRSIFVKIKLRHNISFLQNTHIKRKRGNRSFRNAQQRTKNQGGKTLLRMETKIAKENRQRRR